MKQGNKDSAAARKEFKLKSNEGLKVSPTFQVMTSDWELEGLASTSVGGPSGTSSLVVRSTVRLGCELPTAFMATSLKL